MRNYWILFFVAGSLMFAAPASRESLVGDWHGKSIGVAARTQGKDEEVVYHITSHNQNASELVIDADKIVDGRSIPMGRLIFLFDPKQNLLTCDSGPGGLWSLKVEGSFVAGTLTSQDGTILRRVNLRKEN